jgi:chitodextrinase
MGSSPALAARDRQAPTKPTNLRVTSLTSHNASLAWNPSTDNSGTFSYRLWVSYGSTITLPQTQTTFSLSLVPANTYSFYVYAVDGSGNKSAKSNTLTVTTPPDNTAPTAPVVSLFGVNPTEIAVQWSASTDDGPHIFYQVYVNGSPNVDARQKLHAVVTGLTPETTYEITVRARDLYGGNLSAPSNALNVTTAAVSATDTAPPSAPTGFNGHDVGDGGEIDLSWTQSFDNQTAQASIRYEVWLNGVLDHATTGSRAAVYGIVGENTLTLIAVDAAGNKSAPVTITAIVQ